MNRSARHFNINASSATIPVYTPADVVLGWLLAMGTGTGCPDGNITEVVRLITNGGKRFIRKYDCFRIYL